MSRPLNRIKASVAQKEAKRRAGKYAQPVTTKPLTQEQAIAKSCALTAQRMQLLVKSVVEQFATDPTFPSVTLSYKTNSNEYYASITRYSNTYGREPKSLINACGDSLGEALEKLFEMWLNRIAPTQNATAALRQSREKGEI